MCNSSFDISFLDLYITASVHWKAHVVIMLLSLLFKCLSSLLWEEKIMLFMTWGRNLWFFFICWHKIIGYQINGQIVNICSHQTCLFCLKTDLCVISSVHSKQMQINQQVMVMPWCLLISCCPCHYCFSLLKVFFSYATDLWCQHNSAKKILGWIFIAHYPQDL